jgi:hypothetical protein
MGTTRSRRTDEIRPGGIAVTPEDEYCATQSCVGMVWDVYTDGSDWGMAGGRVGFFDTKGLTSEQMQHPLTMDYLSKRLRVPIIRMTAPQAEHLVNAFAQTPDDLLAQSWTLYLGDPARPYTGLGGDPATQSTMRLVQEVLPDDAGVTWQMQRRWSSSGQSEKWESCGPTLSYTPQEIIAFAGSARGGNRGFDLESGQQPEVPSPEQFLVASGALAINGVAELELIGA